MSCLSWYVYITIIFQGIVSSSILGFVYCGLHCCCLLPQTSPILTYQQRSNAIENINILQSLTLGGGYKSYNNSEDDTKTYMNITKGNIDDITNNNDDYDFKESFA